MATESGVLSFAVGPQKHKVPHEYGLELVSGADCRFKVDVLQIWGSPRSMSEGSLVADLSAVRKG